MNGSINYFFELVRMQQREYEAQAKRNWEQNVSRGEKPTLSNGRILALALIGFGVTVVLLGQVLSL